MKRLRKPVAVRMNVPFKIVCFSDMSSPEFFVFITYSQNALDRT